MSSSDFINLSNIWWWVVILINFTGYFLLRYGMVSDARLRLAIEITGSLLLLLSFIVMFIFFGFPSVVGLVLIFWITVTPIVEIIINKIKL